MTTGELWSRRRWLGASGLAALGAGLAVRGQDASKLEEELGGRIVRSLRPLDLETPTEAFDRFLTPTELFYVRSHFGAPAMGLVPPSLEVTGLVERALRLTPADLNRFERVTIPAVCQCSGNGRSFFEPKVTGLAWGRGAVGNAEWSGVRLADVLRAAGLKGGVRHVHLLGADRPPAPKTPPFLRSIPIERALQADTLIATHMNGQELPHLHGGPWRLVVPTWSGNHWMKWLVRISAEPEEAPGHYMRNGYRMPKPPGPGVGPDETVPLTTMNVKSLIARPGRSERVTAGPVTVRGVAWTGAGVVTSVAVEIDGTWRAAAFESPAREGTWRLWSYAWDAKPGKHRVRVRATDSTGAVQPEVTPWNKSGYLWNGIDAIDYDVRPA